MSEEMIPDSYNPSDYLNQTDAVLHNTAWWVFLLAYMLCSESEKGMIENNMKEIRRKCMAAPLKWIAGEEKGSKGENDG